MASVEGDTLHHHQHIQVRQRRKCRVRLRLVLERGAGDVVLEGEVALLPF